MEEEMQYAKDLKENFLKIRNSQYTGDEYYYVIMGIDYDSYDFVYLTTYDIYIDTLKMMSVLKKGLFGTRRVMEECPYKERVGIYAIKNRKGIFEMTTGKRLSVTGESNAINCFGINKISDNGLESVAKDLELLESNALYREQYVSKLLSLSNGVRKTQEIYKEKQKENNSHIQYLKRYKLPDN
jgi:hypothetical protein